MSTLELDGYLAGTDCTNGNPWCGYPEPHSHGGFACDPTCPCRES